jgi:diguanylate cyclase (GGDEF)-like protein
MEALQQMISNYQVILLLIAVVFVLYLIYRIVRAAGRNEVKSQPVPMRNHYSEQTRIHSLQSEVRNLHELNTRYLTFMINVSEMVKTLHTTSSFEEIKSTIIRMVNDLIATELVELYVFDEYENRLMRVVPLNKDTEETISYVLGEGLVGNVGKYGIVKSIEDYHAHEGITGSPESPLSMAAPIHFRNILLGVLGIGQVKNPAGNERTLLRMIADIGSVALFNQSQMKEWKNEANTDPLTQLYNRRYFLHVSIIHKERSMLENQPLSFFLFDLDNFKNYNDTNGHQEGDRLLKELARLLQGISRKNSVIARYGGEEFIVMLPGISKADSYTYADRVREQIASHSFAHGEKQPLGFVSISGGVACFPDDGDTVEKVIKMADKALYEAKREGKNRVKMFQPFTFSDM